MDRLEIEVKLRFEDPEAARRAIAAAGGREVRSRHFEDNHIFDTPGADLVSRGALLRVRIVEGEAALLTYKEKVPSDVEAKVRAEVETRVESSEGLIRILERLGLTPIYRYQKYRTVFRRGETVLDLDETPVGCFVEVEGTPAGIDEAIRAMGLEGSPRIVENYRTLHRRYLEERGLPHGPMIFEEHA